MIRIKIAKVAKIGNSLTLRLTKEVLARLKLEEGDSVFLTEAPDGGYRLTPYDPDFARQMDAAAEVMKKRRSALRERAE